MHKIRGALLVIAILAVIAVATGPGYAHAVPASPSVITPDTTACAHATTGDIRALAACGAGYTQEWLAYNGVNGVVKRTVLLPNNTIGIHQSQTTGFICGYVETTVFSFGLHHCDGTTYVSATHDPKLVVRPSEAIAAFIHESGHGMQERAGLDPVLATLTHLTGPELFPYEQSSDCWSGAAYRWFVSRHVPYVDVLQATAFFRRNGIDGSDGTGHGSPTQRVSAFKLGYDQGSRACNVYFNRYVFPGS